MFELTNDKINIGDLTPFTIYFLGLIETSLKELIDYFTDQTQRLKFYRDKINNCLTGTYEYKKALFILTQGTMFGYEGMGIEELSEALGKSSTTTRKIVKQFGDDGFLTAKRSRPVLYNVNLDKIGNL